MPLDSGFSDTQSLILKFKLLLKRDFYRNIRHDKHRTDSWQKKVYYEMGDGSTDWNVPLYFIYSPIGSLL